MRPKGLAIAAVIVAGIAFIIGWMPFFGFVVGAVAVVLAVVALVKRQPKALAVTAMALGGVAALTSVIVTGVAVASIDWSKVEAAPKSVETQTAPPKSEVKTTPKPTAEPTPKETQKPEKTADPEKSPQPPKETPKPTPKPKPKPKPEKKATSGGLTAGMAEVACEHAAEQVFTYGVKVHWLTGSIAERLEKDAWFLKVEITPKNEYGTKINGVVMECTVTGSEAKPKILEFDAY